MKKRLALLLCLVILALTACSAPAAAQPDDVLQAYFLDVGQGDCALLLLPNGQTMLIDAGEARIGPCPGWSRQSAPWALSRSPT